jgi:ubiquinone biosynthesis UbiH/UbiF/VisC/COQ6 family hydroxylase
MMETDILVIGAGPAGLSLALALSGQGLNVTVVEQQPQSALENPAFDGREIALTQHSHEWMQRMGLWAKLPMEDVARISSARILDGASPQALNIPHELSHRDELGYLVPNHLIRKAAWLCLKESMDRHGDVTLLTGRKVVSLVTQGARSLARLDDEAVIEARLSVAADSRFSATRRMMGIAADMHDFGRNMLVCAMTHDEPHHFEAWEWFDYGQTLALLPMNADPLTGEHRSSVVITVPSHESDLLVKMEEAEFNADAKRRFAGRLGNMRLVSTRHAYPLVTVYPKRLVADRFATVGDAAVGMHPVTAHGFNFGLLSVEELSKAVLSAHSRQQDIGARGLLMRYEMRHRIATRPLFMITRLITEIYTRESPPMKLARRALIRLGEKFPPFKRQIALAVAKG